MQHFLKRLLQLVLVVVVSVPLWAGDGSPSGKASTAKNESLTGAAMSTESDAALSPALLGILVMKRVLTSDEANNLRRSPSASGASQLLNLLKEKGVVTDADLVQANLAPTASLNLATATTTTSSPQGGQAAPKPAAPPEPALIPAEAPQLVLPIAIP